MSFCSDVGELLLGTRFKRVGDRFIQDMALVYKYLDLDFEAAWFPFVYLLNERKKTSLTQMALDLEITHSAASQMITVLEKKEIVEVVVNADDGRKKIVFLTSYGNRLVRQLLPVWDVMKKCVGQVLSQAKEMDMLDGISLIERELSDGKISGKVIDLLKVNKNIDVYNLNEISEEEIGNLKREVLSPRNFLDNEVLVAKNGEKPLALLCSAEINGMLSLKFIELEPFESIYLVCKDMLARVLDNYANNIIELTSPSDDFLRAVIDSGHSFMVNRLKV